MNHEELKPFEEEESFKQVLQGEGKLSRSAGERKVLIWEGDILDQRDMMGVLCGPGMSYGENWYHE